MTFKQYGAAIVIGAVLSIALSISTADAAIKAKSVWKKTSHDTISSHDIHGNYISFVCNSGRYDVYLSTVEHTTRRYANISLWASRDNRAKFTASVLGGNNLRVRLTGSDESRNVLKDMRNRYDLSVYIDGDRFQTIILFALDGFSTEFNRTCR